MKLNLGSGPRPLDGYLNVDAVPQVQTALVCDALALPFRADTFDAVRCWQMLQYIAPEHQVTVMAEVWRVLKPSAEVEFFCPRAGGPEAFAAPGFRSCWSLLTFECFERGNWRCEFDRMRSRWVGGFTIAQAYACNYQRQASSDGAFLFVKMVKS